MATVDINLYYDLDRRRWTTSAGGLATQPSLFIGQSNDIDFRVRFVQGGVPIELTSPSWIAGIKVTDDPLGDYLLLTTTGTQTGSGATTIYTFSLNIDSVELQAYLVGITPTTNSTAFEVRDTVNNIATLPAITCSILPDYTLTGATPAAGSGTLVVDSGATFTVHESFAMPTNDGQNNYVLKTNGAGVGSWAVDSAGTGTVTNVAVTTANGVSGSVATSTTTPAITLTLGAITPTTGAFSNTTDATSSTDAPLKTAGGLAVAKKVYIGTDLTVSGFSYFEAASFDEDVTMVSELILSGNAIRADDLLISDYASNAPIASFNSNGNVGQYITLENVTNNACHIYVSTISGPVACGLHLRALAGGFVNIEDSTDNTKRIKFDFSSQLTEVTTTLASSSTTSKTITLPNATTTLAGLAVTQTFTAANTFSLTTDATSSAAGAVMISGGLAVAKKLYVGTTLFLSNGHRVTFFTSTTTIAQPTLFGSDSGAGQGSITFGSFGADGTTALYGGINAEPAILNCYAATLTCSYVVFQPGGGIKDSGGNIALTVTSNKQIAMGGTLAVTGTTTCTGGVIFGTYTVSTFPATTYLEAVVTDALSPVVGSTVNAGGSAKCKVMYNGSAKIVTAVL